MISRNIKVTTLFVVSVLVVLLACSTASPGTQPALDESVAYIQQYAASFHGISAEVARSKLSGAKIREESWKEGEYGGRQLVATFPKYEIRLFFFGNKVITTSLQIISK